MLLMLSLVAGLAAAPPPPTLTLADALARARQASPLREPAVRASEGAEAAARLAGRLPNPQVDVQLENLGAGDTGLGKDVFARVNQTVEFGGKRGIRRALAEGERELAAAAVGLTDLALASRTATAYLETLRARQRVEVLEASRVDLTTAAEVMARRLAEGLVAEADVLKVRADLARLELDLIRARLGVDQRATELAYLIGLPDHLDPSSLAEPLVPAPPALDAAALTARLAGHPDVKAQEARVARARQARALEVSRRIPDALATGGYKRTSGIDTLVAGVIISVPLFDRNGAAVARADGDLRAAEAEQRAVLARLRADAESTGRAARALAARAAEITRELVTPAEAVRAAASAALQEGAVDVLRLLDAERVLREAKHLAIDTRLDAAAAAMAARVAAGEEILP